MKLIEKLALEACGCKGVADECGCWAYEAGFRKAREMALVLDPVGLPGSYFEAPRELIEQLGEEEA